MTLTVTTSTTISADEIAASGPAIDYGADNITVTIDTGIAVLSNDDTGIFSSSAGSILVNVGNIASAGTFVSAVSFRGANAFIQNEFGHNISGAGFGLSLGGNLGVFNNYGTVIGLTQAGFLFDSFAVSGSVTNFGDIYGRDEGIWAASAAGGSIITNSGTIRSDHYGIKVTLGTLDTFIINSGKISGTEHSIRVEGTAAIGLTNTGTLEGSLSSAVASGNDTIQNRGTINGIVALGGGNDIFNGIGGKSGAIFGGTGNDTLTGGKGGDTIWGHEDSDVFKFVKVSETGKGANRDAIMDFSDVEGDLINLIDIDAKTGPGNQNFHFIGSQKFHHKAGELRVLNKGAFFLVEGDINGDGKADFQIEVTSNAPLEKIDFLGVF